MTTHPHGASPTSVGDYAVLTRLGEGGMGIVHLARGGDGRRVALKVLRPHIVGDDEARARLAREVSSLSRVRSPWVAEILDADPWAEIPYVVTRYVPGLSLHDHVLEEGPIADRDLLWLAGCLAEGIAAVHAAGVLHRDVKPSNVLMEGRTPILIDFGLARVADDPRLTHTGWLMGTPGYLAPEILYGDDATPAADVHSWAATVAYGALGRPPYGRGPSMAIMDRARRGEHDLTGVEGPLADVLDAALDPDPLARPLLSEILAWLRPLSTQPSAAAVPPPVQRDEPEDDFTLPLAIAAQAGQVALDGPDGLDAPADHLAAPRTPDTVPERHTRVLPTDTAPPAPPAPPTVGPYVGGLDTPPLAPDPFAGHGAGPDPFAGRVAAEGRGGVSRPDGHPFPGEPMVEPMMLPPRVSFGERLRRGLQVACGGLVVGATTAAAPYLSALLVVLTVWMLRTGSLAGSAGAGRRTVRGRRWYDGPQVAVSTPWHSVRALTGTAVLVLWSAGLALAAGLLCYAAAMSAGQTLFAAGTTLGVALWSGPGASRLRSPLSRIVHPLARRWGPTLGMCLVLLVLAAAVAAVVLDRGVSWAPASGPPFGL